MVLGSLAQQRRGRQCADYEVIVADDGSGAETAALIARLQAAYPVPLLHAWQPDTGFRLAQSRNNAVLQATGDYVIFMDGDCLVTTDFILTHSRQIGRAHVWTPVTNAHLVCRLLLEKKKKIPSLV